MPLFNLAPTTIVVFCSDPRFQESFYRLIFSELRLSGLFAPIAVMGGGAVLAESAICSDERICVAQHIEKLLDGFPTITKVVLVGHEDCKLLGAPIDVIKGFLLEAGETVKSLHPHVTLRLYFVRADGSFVVVEPSQQQQAQPA